MKTTRKPALQPLNKHAALKQLEAIAFGMTDSSKPRAESRHVAQFAAGVALESLCRQVEYMEALNNERRARERAK